MKKLVIDHFEGPYAICEDETKAFQKIPKYKLPLSCKEGDALVRDSDGMFQMAKNESKGNESKIREKMSRLLEK